ncbi:MAG: LacI family DNA-binding transcriptional regulator [Eubacteriales bacterium]|nr:LacI family DNA-binding transcriptional regulator [Eubacteriales bacterium]
MAITIKDLADQLNLSQATISLALNNRPGVNANTRTQVLELAERLGYDTRLMTRRNQQSGGNIRLVVYKKSGRVVADTPFFLALTEGIEAAARTNGRQLMISHISDLESQNQVMQIVYDNPQEGIILLATELSLSEFLPFFRANHPLVVLDGSLSDTQSDAVLINNFQGAYDAVQELRRNGHRLIGYLKSNVPIYNFSQRHLGVIQAMIDENSFLDSQFICAVEPSADGAYRETLAWLDTNPPLPTAFFADNDIIAFGAMRAFKEKGLQIPRDLSIIGFDDLPYCEMIDPPLTTVRVFKHSLGRLAVERLLERMNGKVAENVRIEVATELVRRQSVATI